MLLTLAPALAAGNHEPAEGPWPSASGAYRLDYESDLEPIVINRIHTWILHLERHGGEPVTDADITVKGGMPAHDHGLPTQPRVTAHLGKGDYRLQGMRFHMNGYWEIEIEITVDGDRDTVTIPLEL